MNMATIVVSGVYAHARMYSTIPVGIVGATATFEFTDPIWEGLTKTAVFQGAAVRDVILTGNTAIIPAETVAKAGPTLKVGIYGVDTENNLVIPTLWATIGGIRDAADPSGDPGTNPDLPIWAQLADRVEDIAKDVEELQQTGGGGPGTPGKPGADGEDGGYYTPEVTQLDEDTIRFAFTPSKADMPAVEPVTVELPAGHGSGGNVDPAAYGLPILYLTGDTAGMSKDNAVTLDYVYGERSGTASVKWQGNSSLSYPKKNYTIKFDNAFEAAEGWGEQKKYCLKANYIDHSHARNIVSAKLWGEIVKSRQDEGGVTGMIDTKNNDISRYLHITDGVINVRTSVYRSGGAFFTGNTYPAGEHTITFELYNPYTAETDTSFAQFIYGVPDDLGYVNVNSKQRYGEWLPRSVTVDFPVDGSMIGIIAYSPDGDPTGENGGYSFRNIKIDGETYPIEPKINVLKSFVNGGAIDGFPCVIILNGVFHGLYTFNIPKDGWMFGMSDSTAHQAIVCADTQNDACGFKALATLTDDFDLEYVSDENDSDWVLTSLNTMISAVMNSDGADLDTTVSKYLDWQSAIDYYIFTSLVCGTDMVRKNYLLATYDGVKWFFSAYDMDSTYGMRWNGKGFNSTKAYPYIGSYNHHVMELIWKYKKDELLARYEKIRNSAMSEDNVYLKFTNFASDIPSTILAEDAKKWAVPSSSASNTAQILNWYRLRTVFVDKQAGTT